MACKEREIEVIGVTDHYRVKESESLVQAAREAGLFAFSGFEAVTKDGVHFLCLFDPDKDSVLERFIGECGVHDNNELSPTGSLDAVEFLGCARKWGAICIAAHVAGDGGLLKNYLGDLVLTYGNRPSFWLVRLPDRLIVHRTTLGRFWRTKTGNTKEAVLWQ